MRNAYSQTLPIYEQYNGSPLSTIPTGMGGQTYIPQAEFRPVPYPRPLAGIQIKIRVLEPRTGLAREATIRHFFPKS